MPLPDWLQSNPLQLVRKVWEDKSYTREGFDEEASREGQSGEVFNDPWRLAFDKASGKLRYYRDDRVRGDEWTYTPDNDFAKDLFETSPWDMPSQSPESNQRCVACSDILHFNRHVSLSGLRSTRNDCQLCELLLHALEQYGQENQERIHIVRAGSFLKMGKDGKRILRLCSDLGFSGDNQDDIQIGFPELPQAASPMHFELLRAWLRRCDQSHDCNTENEGNRALPTRVLYAGDPNPDILILRHSTEVDEGKYIALSHCWGKLAPEEQGRICTNLHNLKGRLKRFNVHELPQTFQDAVRVTRELGIPYLWIDSLCIVQDDEEDWNREAPRMEDVYASAYCTIAASSGASCYEGFLKRGPRSNYIQVQDASGNRYYVCADMDDFDNDVGKALLNTRAWVLQERVLSRRIIHFSINHTYFECGQGVNCESLTRMSSQVRMQYFQMDPRFPNRLLESGRQRAIEFIHLLLQNYTNCGITQKTDRVVAVSGLEARIARALKSGKRFGIFERLLHRNILWQRTREKTERINYGDQKVPSWSWMAYDGGIQFLNIPFGVEWSSNLRFDNNQENALIAEAREFRHCRMEQEETKCIILDSRRIERGWVQFDVEGGTNIYFPQRVVVVGRTWHPAEVRKYYILVVKPTCLKGEYERVGIGSIETGYVSRQKLNVRVV